MRPRRIGPLLAVTAVLTLSGCGYVHFGRVPEGRPVAPLGDEQLLKENSNLRTEKKILQQELALTRAQGEALRMAIENRAADGDTSKRLTEKLTQTTRELATLRADYAKLQLDRAAAPTHPAEIAELKSKLGATEDKLASSLKNYTQLQDEIGHLRTDLDQTRTENTALTAQVKVVTAKNDEAQAALAQLNADLLAQKNSRAAAEQDASTLRTQLDTANTKLTVLAQQRTAPAAEARALNAPGSDGSTKAGAGESPELRAQLDTLRKKVWSLESERNELQQKVSALETAGKTPSLAEIKARAESEVKLTAALEGAKMLRAENDQLKSSASELAKSKNDLEAELARARAVLPLAAQAQTLREQLQQVQTQAASLADENSKLKARLAVMGGSSGSNGTLQLTSANLHPTPAAPVTPAAPGGGVTATFVTNVPTSAAAAGPTTNATFASATANAKNRTAGVALRFHTVTSGDTLSKISNTYYGSPGRWAEILVANRDILGEDNNLVIGRTLRIP
jgi:nucleoid-associated protein YgaU